MMALHLDHIRLQHLSSRSPFSLMLITLIGYRGTGKSTVAGVLAQRLGWNEWVDADPLIEQRAGRSIREIFAEQGEAGFRRLERSVMQELLRRHQIVLAAGGGAILDEHTRRELPAAGPVVWLQATVETILQRLQTDATTSERRPNLTASGGREEIESVLSARTPLYNECADIAVTTDDRTTEQIVDEIIARLEPRLQEGVAG